MTPRKRRHLGRRPELSFGHDPDLIARYLSGEQVIAQRPEMEHEDRGEREPSGASNGHVSHSADFGIEAHDKAEWPGVDVAKHIHDKAEALRAYLKKARAAEVQTADNGQAPAVPTTGEEDPALAGI
jgi:hypothetical protein